MNLDCNQNLVWRKTCVVPLGLAFVPLIFLECSTAFSDLFWVRILFSNTLSAAMYSLSFVLLIWAIIVHFNLLQRPGWAFAEASPLEELVLPDTKLITDLEDCVTLAIYIVHQERNRSGLVVGRGASFLSVQSIFLRLLLWQLQEKDKLTKVRDKAFEALLPVVFVDPSGHR